MNAGSLVGLTLGVLAIAALGYFAVLYNGLVRLKHNVSKAWANIDVLLKQRHDELPKLVESCKRYMAHEKETLLAVVEARAAVASARERSDIRALGGAETRLRTGLGQLFAVAEGYPDLKANGTFLHLQGRITGLEQDIADRREFYNDSVTLLNVRISEFPDVFVARSMGFEAAECLRFSQAELADVNMKELFS